MEPGDLLAERRTGHAPALAVAAEVDVASDAHRVERVVERGAVKSVLAFLHALLETGTRLQQLLGNAGAVVDEVAGIHFRNVPAPRPAASAGEDGDGDQVRPLSHGNGEVVGLRRVGVAPVAAFDKVEDGFAVRPQLPPVVAAGGEGDVAVRRGVDHLQEDDGVRGAFLAELLEDARPDGELAGLGAHEFLRDGIELREFRRAVRRVPLAGNVGTEDRPFGGELRGDKRERRRIRPHFVFEGAPLAGFGHQGRLAREEGGVLPGELLVGVVEGRGILVEAGGLGLVTFFCIYLAMPSKRVSYVDKKFIRDFFTDESKVDSHLLLLRIVGTTLLIQTAGAILLAVFLGRTGEQNNVFYGIFLAITSFCNAGFAPYSDNLVLQSCPTLPEQYGQGFSNRVFWLKNLVSGTAKPAGRKTHKTKTTKTSAQQAKTTH